MDDGIYLHVGCGLTAPQGWVNIDASWNARLAHYPWLRGILAYIPALKEKCSIQWSSDVKFHNVRKALRYPNGTVSAVYASHLLEHLYRSDARFFLGETLRVLKPGGICRIITPDLKVLAQRYITVSETTNVEAANEYLSALLTYPDYGQSGLVARILRSANNLHSHKWLYDVPSLSNLMRDVGFSRVCQRSYLDSGISHITNVEQEGQFLDAICVEAVK
jgi:ubiquinone/menaquinone biosynthesis C-methylase UbiE